METDASNSAFDDAWLKINKNRAYWNDTMLNEDYYFIESLWGAYATELSAALSSTAASDYAAFDKAAWITANQLSVDIDETAWPTNIYVLTRVMSEADWHYWFGQANVKLSDILKAFSYFPSFCGEVYDDSTQNVFDVCRQELALFLTYVKYGPANIEWEAASCYDLSVNEDGACYGVSDFAQITSLAPSLGST